MWSALGELVFTLGGLALEAITANEEKRAKLKADARAAYEKCEDRLFSLEQTLDDRNTAMLLKAKLADAAAAPAPVPEPPRIEDDAPPVEVSSGRFDVGDEPGGPSKK